MGMCCGQTWPCAVSEICSFYYFPRKRGSIAFCCISTGVFRFPQERAAEIAVKTVRSFLEADSSIQQVIFNVFTDKDLEIYQKLLNN